MNLDNKIIKKPAEISAKSSSRRGIKRKMAQSTEIVKKVKLNSQRSVTKPKQLKSQSRRKVMSAKEYFVSKVVGRRRSQVDEEGKRIVEYLVRWEGYGPKDDTWEECKADVFKKGDGKYLIPHFLSILKANASPELATKSFPVILDFGDIPPSLRDDQNTYIRVVNNVPPKSIKTAKTLKQAPNKRKMKKKVADRDCNDGYALPAVCSQIARKWSEFGKARAVHKAQKAKQVVSKIKSSKAQAVRMLQKKQQPNKKKKDSLKVPTASRKKKEQSTKGKKPAKSRQTASKSQVKNKKSFSVSHDLFGISSSSSNDSDFLYSLTSNNIAGGDGSGTSFANRKRLFINISQDARASESSTGTPDTDPEISFKNSPRKRMLLKDSIRPKSETGCHSIEVVTPATPASHPSPYRTPPSSPGGAGPSIQTPPLANRATTAMAEVIPSSPAAATYMKNIAASLQQKKKKSGGSDSSQERRVSLRQSEGAFKYKEIVVKKTSGYTQILLYSQTKAKNALNPAVIEELKQVLHNARYDDTRVVLLSGSGNTFCSGVDLHYLIEGNPTQRAQKMADAVKDLVNILIEFPKPIVVAVNGPAVGLGVAMLPLCDLVYASDKATFYCPYGRLGQTPEGAASFTFPAGLGLAMANDLLLAGRRLTATQAMQAGLVSQVFWPTTIMNEVVVRVVKMSHDAAATPNSHKALELSKMLIRGPVKAKLVVSNDSETAVLAGRWMAADCQKLIHSYIDKEQHLYL